MFWLLKNFFIYLLWQPIWRFSPKCWRLFVGTPGHTVREWGEDVNTGPPTQGQAKRGFCDTKINSTRIWRALATLFRLCPLYRQMVLWRAVIIPRLRLGLLTNGTPLDHLPITGHNLKWSLKLVKCVSKLSIRCSSFGVRTQLEGHGCMATKYKIHFICCT